jgi:hypothetical protein
LVSLIQVLTKKQLVVGGFLFNSTTQTYINDRDENGILATEVFSEQQTSDDVLK